MCGYLNPKSNQNICSMIYFMIGIGIRNGCRPGFDFFNGRCRPDSELVSNRHSRCRPGFDWFSGRCRPGFDWFSGRCRPGFDLFSGRHSRCKAGSSLVSGKNVDVDCLCRK